MDVLDGRIRLKNALGIFPLLLLAGCGPPRVETNRVGPAPPSIADTSEEGNAGVEAVGTEQEETGACTPGEDCPEGTYCAMDTEPWSCRPLPEGSCEVVGCDAGLYCDWKQSPPECRDRLEEGAPCEAHDWCIEDLFCEFDHDPSACAPRLGEDETCWDDPECASGMFCEIVYDDEPGECKKAPVEGGECEWTNAVCAPGLYCDLLQYPAVCSKPGKKGHPCEDDEACAAGYHCDVDAEEPTCREGDAPP